MTGDQTIADWLHLPTNMSRRKRKSGKRKKSRMATSETRSAFRHRATGEAPKADAGFAPDDVPASPDLRRESEPTEGVVATNVATVVLSNPKVEPQKLSQPVSLPHIEPRKNKYRLDRVFNPLHTGLEWAQTIMESALDVFLRIFMTKPVQFTAGVTTGIFCLMLVYQILTLALSLFATTYYL